MANYIREYVNCLLDRRLFMAFLLFKDKTVLFLGHRLAKP